MQCSFVHRQITKIQKTPHLKPLIENNFLLTPYIKIQSLILLTSTTNLNPSDLARTKFFNNSPMLRMNLWPKITLHFTLTATIRCHLILKNLLYLRQYHSTPSLLNNPDSASYQDIPSNSPQHESDHFEFYNPRTSIETIVKPKTNFHSPPIYQNLLPSIPPNDNLDIIFIFSYSDFEMLQNPIYQSPSSPQFYPRVALSQILFSETEKRWNDKQRFGAFQNQCL